jgi:hypothetical protein
MLPYEGPAWKPGRYCPACTTSRHLSWRTVAECRWSHKLLWVMGNPRGEQCWATISRCRHPGTRESYVTVVLHGTIEAAEAAMRMIAHTGCGGSCSRLHELVVMHEGNEVSFDD